MNKYKKLSGNIVVYAIGNLGSKLLAFILVPIYTAYLSTAQYGQIDLTISTVAMLLPIAYACVHDAVLRFALDEKEDKREVISNALAGSLLLLTLTTVLLILFSLFIKPINYLFYLILLLSVEVFESILSQYLRAIGKVKHFAIKGIILTFTSGLYSILAIVVLKLGIKGYFLGYTLAYLSSIIYIVLVSRVYKDFKFDLLGFDMSKKLYRYSLPLVPNSTLWWVINSSSKFFIDYNYGTSLNGIFAVSVKIPTLINIITQVFNQAWQVSAIEEYNDEDKNKFYSDIFNMLSAVLFLGGFFILLLIKDVFRLVFDEVYFPAWEAVPLLVLGTIFSSFSGFLGTNYVAAKKTSNALKTSVYGGTICLLLNFLLIPTWGIIGASISNALGFLAMWIIRIYDTGDIVRVEIDFKSLLPNILIYLLVTLALFLNLGSMTERLIAVVALVLGIFVNIRYIKRVLSLVLSIFKKDTK